MAKSEQRIALEAIYKKLAKRADQRLVRLEKASSAGKISKNIMSSDIAAYMFAERAVQHYDKAGAGITYYDNGSYSYKPRFNRGIPKSDKLLRMKIKDIEKFLSMVTSKVSGIVGVAEKRTRTMNYLYKTNLTTTQWAQIWESGLGDKLIAKYGSKTAFTVLATVRTRKNTFSALLNQVKNAVNDSTKERRLEKWMKKHKLTGEIDIDNLPE